MASPFKTECKECGDEIYMFPGGRQGWVPVDPDEDSGEQPEGDVYDRETMVDHRDTCKERS